MVIIQLYQIHSIKYVMFETLVSCEVTANDYGFWFS